ncbi:MAG: hypothetical protein NZ700_04550 [Gemmataceae bacterium]|nr:hypothetical protein [Gemmataceae bacterium]MDW8266491.1 hypothetical protein [Gemmataceae bacterium]
MNVLTRIALVALRLAIGWHFFIEGAEKLHAPTWSSEGYLREAAGPFAEAFRQLAGDGVIERLTPLPLPEGADPAKVTYAQRFPPALERDWQHYFRQFVEHYQLTPDQLALADAKLKQAKDQAVRWMLSGKKTVKRQAPNSPAVEVELTVPERVQEYRDKLQRALQIQDRELATFGPSVNAKLREAKAEANRLRAELRHDLNAQTEEMKKLLATIKLTAEQLAKGPVPEPAQPGVWELDRLGLVDFVTRWGIFLVGCCLLLGLLTRTACLVGAGFLLLFYLAMPPFPGVPENLRAEGHYLYVNKNLIEMLALLALATTRSGRWLGLDAWLQFLAPSRWRSPAARRAEQASAEPLPVG